MGGVWGVPKINFKKLATMWLQEIFVHLAKLKGIIKDIKQ